MLPVLVVFLAVQFKYLYRTQGINQTLQGSFNGPFPIDVSWVLSQLGLPEVSKSHKIEK